MSGYWSRYLSLPWLWGRTTPNNGREIENSSLGLKTLYEPQPEDCPSPSFDVVAIHGIGAFPDETWVDTVKDPEDGRDERVNWLKDKHMLPSAEPCARIMQYGYKSWYIGTNAVKQRASTVAQRLLYDLNRQRQGNPTRPLIFIAHCFGGLALLQAVVFAKNNPEDWPGVFQSITGMIFLGTPFRGSEVLTQAELLRFAINHDEKKPVQPSILYILAKGNDILEDLRDSFQKTRKYDSKARIFCFFETEPSDLTGIFGRERPKEILVDETSGCLDYAEKRSMARNHFNMNKFTSPKDVDYLTLTDAMSEIYSKSHEIIQERMQGNTDYKIPFSLKGVPLCSNFVGRETELDRIQETLLPSFEAHVRRRIFVSYGLGGIGKTQLSVEFARRHKNDFSAIFWIDGSSKVHINNAMAGLCRRISNASLSEETKQYLKGSHKNTESAIHDILRWLESPFNTKWLLIFDNVDRDIKTTKAEKGAFEVNDFFPTADHGSILVTTRLPGLQRLGQGQKLGVIDNESAFKIVQSQCGYSREETLPVVSKLEGLPLALVQAGAYLRLSGITPREYIELHKLKWDELMRDQPEFLLNDYNDRNIWTTWAVSIEMVRSKHPDAVKLLQLWAFLDNKEVWWDLFTPILEIEGATIIPEWLVRCARSKVQFCQWMSSLIQFSLVEGRERTSSYSIHSELHRWCGYLTPDGKRSELIILAKLIVGAAVDDENPRNKNLRNQRRALPHADRLLMGPFDSEPVPVSTGNAAPVLCLAYENLASLYEDQGRFEAAKDMFFETLSLKEKIWGINHVYTLDTFFNIASLYQHLGELKIARKIFINVLIGFSIRRGIHHVSTLDAIHRLGDLYHDLKMDKRAEKLFLVALSGYKRVLKTGKERIFDVMHNLANVYIATGKYEMAKRLLFRALIGYKKTVGTDKKRSIHTLTNLGRLYQTMGSPRKAEYILLLALLKTRKLWGVDHYEEFSVLGSLGHVYEDLGLLKCAKALHQRSWSGFKKYYGPNHVLTRKAQNNLVRITRLIEDL